LDRAGVYTENGRLLATTSLHSPRLAAVERSQEQAELADRPAALRVREKETLNRQRLAGLLDVPGLAPVRTVQHDRTRSPGDPNLFAHAMDGVEVPIAEQFRWQIPVRQLPGVAGRFVAEEDEAALAHGHRLLTQDLQSTNV